jgi:mono/diheme cytochrome c family protein
MSKTSIPTMVQRMGLAKSPAATAGAPLVANRMALHCITRSVTFFMMLAAGLASITQVAHASDATPSADASLVQRGEYLARAGDCIACHTAAHGQPFAGGQLIPTPIGPIVSTNITPSQTAGIGHYTLDQFSAALRKGVRAGGAHLYPAMPYTSYALLSDDDVKALYAYFMSGVKPVDVAPTETHLPFPFNLRISMALWNALFASNTPYVADASKSVEWNRGAYLVRGLAHCSECHSPRNALMGEDTSRSLGGAEVGGWYAPNISSDKVSGIGGWSADQIVSYLRTGHAADRAQAAGPMAEAVDDSLSQLSDGDLRAMAVYLGSTPPVRDAAETQPAYAWGGPKSDVDSIRGIPLPADANQLSGPQLYDMHCASCHQASAEGVADPDGGVGLPSLFHNTALGHSNANNLVMVMLAGIHRQDDGKAVLMPGFANAMSDQQVATLTNYLLGEYGNPNTHVTVEQVSDLRGGGTSSNVVSYARAALAALVVIVLGGWVGLRARRRARSLSRPARRFSN